MDKKNLNPQQKSPVIRTNLSLPELHEEELTGGFAGDNNNLAPSLFTKNVTLACYCVCSFDGDDE